MKRVWSLFLLVPLLLAGPFSAARGEGLPFPERADVYSAALAEAALHFASGYTAADQKRLAEEAGFEVLLQKHFDKEAADPSHTCAYTVARAPGQDGQGVYLVLVRGTVGGEWYSNFDIAPGGGGSPFAENFLFCAEEVFLDLLSLVGEERPAVLVCGHSRGAACANLLGVLLNASLGPERVYVYTSATPATVLASGKGEVYDANIFNLINPCDLVPRLPLEAWGYARFGTDILPRGEGDAEALARAEAWTAALAGVAPTVEAYYTVRHSLTRSGRGEDGITAFEWMLSLSDALVTLTEGGTEGLSGGTALLPPESDFGRLVALLDGDGAEGILREHLPDRYQSLFFADR